MLHRRSATRRTRQRKPKSRRRFCASSSSAICCCRSSTGMWVDHLYVMDHLKTGIGLRGYGQKDPRVEYEKEAYEIFEDPQEQHRGRSDQRRVPRRHRATSRRRECKARRCRSRAAAPQFEPIPTGELLPQRRGRASAARCTPTATAKNRPSRSTAISRRWAATICAPAAAARSTRSATAPPRCQGNVRGAFARIQEAPDRQALCLMVFCFLRRCRVRYAARENLPSVHARFDSGIAGICSCIRAAGGGVSSRRLRQSKDSCVWPAPAAKVKSPMR